MTTTTVQSERSANRSGDLELAGLLLSTLPRLGKMAMTIGETGPVSANRAGILWQLRERAMRSGELAQRCAMTAPALTEIVDSLGRDGLTRRLEDPGDRRVVLVELTPRGRRELDRFREHMKERVARVLGKLSGEKQKRLRAALADLHEAIEATAGEVQGAR